MILFLKKMLLEFPVKGNISNKIIPLPQSTRKEREGPPTVWLMLHHALVRHLAKGSAPLYACVIGGGRLVGIQGCHLQVRVASVPLRAVASVPRGQETLFECELFVSQMLKVGDGLYFILFFQKACNCTVQ